MNCVAVCLLFIAILQYGYQESLQANDSLSKAIDESNTDVEEVKVTKALQEEQDNILKSKTQKDKATEPDVENTKQSTRKSSPLDQLKGLDMSGNVIQPVIQARERIGGSVSKGVDGIKAMADSAYNFLRDAVGKMF